MGDQHLGGRAVYGLNVRGLADLDDIGRLTTSADHELIPVLLQSSSAPPPPLHELDAASCVRSLPCGRQLALERRTGRATFYGPELSPDLLAHPYMGPVAVPFNRWAGREVFHAAAVVVAGKAWMLVGPRTSGKSTLVAALAAEGVAVLADDLVVTDGSWVYAGPRTVDLREPIPLAALRHSPLGYMSQPAVAARDNTRWRTPLPPVATRWPIGGWFFLRWDDAPHTDPVTPATLLGRLAAGRSLRTLPSDPSLILSLASLPAWDLHRRRQWAELTASVDQLLDHATSAAASAVDSRP